MKYAYIIGTSAFIVPAKVINYADKTGENEFLRINSVYHDVAPAGEAPVLDIDLNIKAIDGTPITLISNKPVNGMPYNINIERDSVQILKPDGTMIINVHQLSDDAAMSLEHNIVAELGVHAPIAVIRLTGEFMTGGLHIRAENEKLYIDENGYATSAMVGKNQLKFTPEGVVI